MPWVLLLTAGGPPPPAQGAPETHPHRLPLSVASATRLHPRTAGRHSAAFSSPQIRNSLAHYLPGLRVPRFPPICVCNEPKVKFLRSNRMMLCPLVMFHPLSCPPTSECAPSPPRSQLLHQQLWQRPQSSPKTRSTGSVVTPPLIWTHDTQQKGSSQTLRSWVQPRD